MTWLLLVGFAVILLFGMVILFGAPYLPTLRKQTEEALDMLALQPGQSLVELGSGDGRVLKAAARRGIYAIGYEINPLLVVWSRLATWRYRQLIQIHWGNFWRATLPKTNAIYVFLLDKYMDKLDKKITQEITQDVKLISFGFQLPNKKPIANRDGLFLYSYHCKS